VYGFLNHRKFQADVEGKLMVLFSKHSKKGPLVERSSVEDKLTEIVICYFASGRALSCDFWLKYPMLSGSFGRSDVRLQRAPEKTNISEFELCNMGCFARFNRVKLYLIRNITSFIVKAG
jgi:hypothetical protein